ncbi:MAG: hypothetical protein C0606_11950 [Hyphomicrobiales bacterium]|nr:MAG: hypothetical protein C0606_11950 [Hyphomicrobiales bacterium]
MVHTRISPNQTGRIEHQRAGSWRHLARNILAGIAALLALLLTATAVTTPASATERLWCGTCPAGYTWAVTIGAPEYCYACTVGYSAQQFADGPFCFSCPAGYGLSTLGSGQIQCLSADGVTAAAVSWAKPNWAKVSWQIPQAGQPCPPGTFAYTADDGYTGRLRFKGIGNFACFGGATYPEAWKSEASCNDYGCNFGQRNTVEECLDLGASKGAAEVVYGVNPPRVGECWLQNSCRDRGPHESFDYYRIGN